MGQDSPSPRAAGKRLQVSVQQDPICEACRQIDFQRVIDLDCATLRRRRNGILIAHLGSRCTTTASKGCTLCRPFTAVALRFSKIGDRPEYELRAYSFLLHTSTFMYSSCPDRLKTKDMPFLAVVDAEMKRSHRMADKIDAVGQIHCYSLDNWQPRAFSPQFVPAKLDYSPVVQWLEYCKLHDKKLCGSKEPQLPGRKVIDCNSLSVIFALPLCSYATLSYVWGDSKRDCNSAETTRNDATGSLPQFLPATIRDIMTVTKNLGLQYLWIDRFCIDQNNPEEKHDQIRQMDVIYARAKITIIAAAGEDGGLWSPRRWGEATKSSINS